MVMPAADILFSCCRSHNLLAGAFSPVNHKGLHQGSRRTSLYLQDIHFTVIIPQVIFFERVDIPRALNTGTCIRQGDLFCSSCLATANTGKIGRGFGKNADEWTRRVEISKGEISGSKCSMCGCKQTYSRLERENV